MNAALKVFDSWALLGWLRGEPCALAVRQLIADAEAGKTQLLMSSINAGEVYYMLVRKSTREVAESFWNGLPSLPLRVITPNEDDVLAAARFKSSRSISYADAFAAGLALKEGATLVTGDKEFQSLSKEIRIEWLSEK